MFSNHMDQNLWKAANDGVVGVKVLVVYYSETGNTEKVARAIADEVSRDHQVHLKKLNEVTAGSLSNYDLVFLGSACHDADLTTPVKGLLEAIPNAPKFKLAGFFTHATYTLGGTKNQNIMFKRWASKCVTSFQEANREKQIDFKGYYNCQGAPSPPLQDFIRREIVTAPDEWEEYIKDVMKHPTSEDLQKAKEFAREILQEFS